MRRRTPLIPPNERLIFALDVPTLKEAKKWVQDLEGLVSFFKIGLELQPAIGADFIEWLLRQGKKVFLDYKYFDVEETVRRAVSQTASLGAHFLTVHGNLNILKAAVQGRGESPLQILAVTVLTSLDTTDIRNMGFPCSAEALVLHRAKMALEAGCDGVIASAREAEGIRGLAKENLLIVTPGIRPEGSHPTEQKRATTPSQAIAAGADYLVVGRPIRDAANPCAVAEKIIADIASALNKRSPDHPIPHNPLF